MEKVSSKTSLKLFRCSTNKVEEILPKEPYRGSTSVVTESETAKQAVSHSENIDAGSETYCELSSTEVHCGKADSVRSERTGGSDSPASVKQVAEDEIADVFPPDSREVAVVLSWNWDSSQRNSSPKAEKTKSSTPRGQKKRSSKICSPLMRRQPPARRKRLLKKEATSNKSTFVSQLRALSEKLQKAKECVQKAEDTDNSENELCFEVSNYSTDKLHQFKQEHNVVKLDNLQEIKNDSFRMLLEDVDEDCLIQCSQEVEKTLQDCSSPQKKSPKLQNHGAARSDKSSPNRTKTPLKGRVQSANSLRRSPRIRNQNSRVVHLGKPKNNSSVEKITETGKVLDDDLVESLLDDEMELLSQVPSPSAILCAEKQKPYMLTNISMVTRAKQSAQGNINGIVNLHAGPSNATTPQQFSPGCHRAAGLVKSSASFTAKKSSSNCSAAKMTKDDVLVCKQEKDITSRYKANPRENDEKVKPFDDSLGEPALCNLLDSVESSALSSSPIKNDGKNSLQQQIPSSPPLRCTPEEIEKKKREALERRNHSLQGLTLNSKNLQTHQSSLFRGDKVKVQQQCPSSPPKRYTPEEIEKKRLEALQIKRQQSLFRTNTCASAPRQRLQQKK